MPPAGMTPGRQTDREEATDAHAEEGRELARAQRGKDIGGSTDVAETDGRFKKPDTKQKEGEER